MTPSRFWLRYPAFFLLACAVALSASADSMKLLHHERSLYREVLVYQTGDTRCMCFTRACRVGRQTCVDMKHPRRIVFSYPQFMLASLYVNPQPRSILLVGLGGGTLPRAINELLPQAQLDIVEIDPAVVRVAKQFFGFAPNNNTRVIESDGRVYVKRARREQRTYDWILLDAFDHEYIPEHLLTREFLQEVKSLLTPQGVLYFSTNRKRFKLDLEGLAGLSITDITAQTLDEDFKRPPPPHRCWAIRN